MLTLISPRPYPPKKCLGPPPGPLEGQQLLMKAPEYPLGSTEVAHETVREGSPRRRRSALHCHSSIFRVYLFHPEVSAAGHRAP